MAKGVAESNLGSFAPRCRSVSDLFAGHMQRTPRVRPVTAAFDEVFRANFPFLPFGNDFIHKINVTNRKRLRTLVSAFKNSRQESDRAQV